MRPSFQLLLLAACALGLTAAAQTPPPPPLLVTLPNPKHFIATVGIYHTGIRVSWGDSSGAEFYELYRANTRDFTQAELRAKPHVLWFNDRQTQSGIFYYYWVRARKYNNRASDLVGPVKGLRGEAPRFLAQPQDVLAHNGTQVQITATAAGIPAVQYQWYKGANQVKKGGRIRGVHSNTLVFHPIRPQDAGDYYLHIFNVTGGVKSRPVKVEVIRN